MKCYCLGLASIINNDSFVLICCVKESVKILVLCANKMFNIKHLALILLKLTFWLNWLCFWKQQNVERNTLLIFFSRQLNFCSGNHIIWPRPIHDLRKKSKCSRIQFLETTGTFIIKRCMTFNAVEGRHSKSIWLASDIPINNKREYLLPIAWNRVDKVMEDLYLIEY